MKEFLISRVVRNTKFSMAHSHYHEFYELYYLVSGSCRMFTGHSLHHVEAGDLLLLSPGTIHRAAYPEENEAERVAVSFDASLLDPLLEVWGEGALKNTFGSQPLQIPIPVRPQVELLLDKIEEEMGRGDPLSVFLRRIISMKCWRRQGGTVSPGPRRRRGRRSRPSRRPHAISARIMRNLSLWRKWQTGPI